MAKATYVVTQDFKTPLVRNSNDPRNPTKIDWLAFKKGQLIAGELQKPNGKPAFVLYEGAAVIPLGAIKAVVTKEIISSADGDKSTPPATSNPITPAVTPKVKYADAAILGGLLGVGVVYLMQKNLWIIKIPDNKNYAYGAGIGAVLGLYLVYRQINNKPVAKK